MTSSIQNLAMLLNKSRSTEDQQFSCISNPKIWSLVHIAIVIEIEFFIYIAVVTLCASVALFFAITDDEPFDLNYGSANNGGILIIIRIIKQQVILTFVYVTAAFLYTYYDSTTTINTITYIIFIRWLIESLLVPFGWFAYTLQYYLRDEVFLDVPYLCDILDVMLKLPLFFIMRYNENKSDFFLHKREICYFFMWCRIFENQVSDKNVFELERNHSFYHQ